MTYYRHREFGVVRLTERKSRYVTIKGSAFRVTRRSLVKLDPAETLDGFSRGDYVQSPFGWQGQVWDLLADASEGNALLVLRADGVVAHPYTNTVSRIDLTSEAYK